MIAAKNEIATVEADFFGDGPHLRRKIERRHTGVAALVIDLVAGRLNQRGRAGDLASSQRRFDDLGVRRADRRDSDDLAGASALHEDRYRIVHALAPRFAMNASSSAKVEALSIGPLKVTARAPAALA
jgi:hypothetical protein